MTARLTLDEKETIMNFNEGDSMVNVFTYNKRWQTGMRQMGIEPITADGKAEESEFPKKWLRLPVKPPHFTEKERDRCQKSPKFVQFAFNAKRFWHVTEMTKGIGWRRVLGSEFDTKSSGFWARALQVGSCLGLLARSLVDQMSD